MANQTISEALRQLESAIEWFEAAGVTNSRRFAGYRSTLEAAAQATVVGSSASSPALDALLTALCESSDLADISRLPLSVVANHRDKLEQIASGTSSYADARIHDPTRTTAFELVTASLFHRSGAEVSLEMPSDVSAILGTDSIFIECKRPTSISALRGRVEDAYSQFRRHLETGIDGYLVIALDVTRLLNASFGVMSGLSRADATLRVDVELAGMLSDAGSDVARALRNAEHRAPVDAVFFRVQCITFEQDISLWTVTSLWRIAPRHPVQSSRFEAMRALFAPLPDMSTTALDYPQLQRLARAAPPEQR